jgi:N-acylneuraminate cytidylyltransferase
VDNRTERVAAPAGFERNDLFLAEMSHFLRMVRGEVEPGCSLEEGEAVLNLILAPDHPGDRSLPAGSRGRPLPETVSWVVFDFDGVMTDNRVWVDEEGRERVAVNRSDGMGIALLRRRGIGALVLSTEKNPVVAARCQKLGIPFLQGIDDKAAALERWLEEKGIDRSGVIFVGNDVNDLACFPLAGFAAAPADAHESVRGAADLVLKAAGGHGAVREICDLLMKTHPAKSG